MIPRQAPVVVPRAGGEGHVAVGVHDGVADLSRAVLLRGSAARLVAEGGELAEGAIADTLLAEGAPSREAAEADARRYLEDLAAHGLVPSSRQGGSEPAGGNVAAEPYGAPELQAADLERLAREVLRRGHCLRYIAQGRSMRPAIPHGSLLEVEPRPFEAVRRGEVALYRAGDDRMVAHRVVGRRGDTLVARGDASPRRDDVGPAEFLGVVRARVGAHGARVPLSTGPRRALGLVTGLLYRSCAFLARTLVVRPLAGTYSGRSLVRSALRGPLWFVSTATTCLERVGARIRRPLDVAHSALLSTAEKDEARRRLYEKRSIQSFTGLDENVSAGLTLLEEALLTRERIPPGRVLVLGCGPGRECLALAERGFTVTGLDREEGMLDRARALTEARGHSVAYRTGEAIDFELEEREFDAVAVFSGLYNMVLPREQRVRMLRACHRHLLPGGRVLVTFLSAYVRPGAPPRPAGRSFWEVVNPEHQAGDFYFLNETVHVFPRGTDVAEEGAEAGFELGALFRDQRAYDRSEGRVLSYAVLKKPLGGA